MPSIHPEISDRLLSYLDGKLDEELRRQVQEHLESCEPCSEEMAAMRAVTRALQDIGKDSRVAIGLTDRYGCPGPDELTSYEAGQSARQAEEASWISRHLDACSRCRKEIDLIRLMGLELSMQSVSTAPQELSAKVEERMMARVRQEKGADRRTPFMDYLSVLSPRLLLRVALGMGLAAAVILAGVVYLQRGPIIVAQRSSEQDVGGIPAPPSSRDARQRQAQESREPKVAVAPASREIRASEPSAPAPSMIARIEPTAPLSSPSIGGQELAAPSAPERPREVAAPPSIQPSLPPLVPAKQGEALKLLILPTPARPELRSAVAAGLQGILETVLPPDRDFPAEPSVDDLTANRRLGRLYGVRYVLEIDVKQARSGYLVLLRAADTETGGVVATRERPTTDERALAAVAGRLATELQQELVTRP